MAKRSSGPRKPRDSSTWVPNHPGVQVERMAASDGTKTTIVGLQHVSYPFTGVVTASDLEAQLREFGADYLDHVAAFCGIASDVVAALRNDDQPSFGWIRRSWGDGEDDDDRNPNGSYTVARRTYEGDLIDRTVLLLAGFRQKDGSSVGGEVGLRIVMHLGPARTGSFPARITGLTLSNIPPGLAEIAADMVPLNMQAVITFLRKRLRLYYSAEEVSIQGLAPDSQKQTLRIFGNGRARERVFAFVTDFSAQGSDVASLARVDLVSNATAPTAMASDAESCDFGPTRTTLASRRPVRAHEHLDPFRVTTARLTTPLQKSSFVVRQTRIGHPDDDHDPTQPQDIDLTDLPLRSDALSAGHAFLRADELVQRFSAYGLSIQDYFKRAKLPIILRHRAPFRGAHDGNTVNARVLPSDIAANLSSGSTTTDPRPQVEVSFGAANLRRRDLIDMPRNRRRLQPMGIAADRRWAWHEFCHVLNYASFGKLEFRFAHSAGDALAAIVCDPDSALRHPPAPGGPFARHITFPWVALGRRHDREARRGWACCGRRNLARLASSTAFDDQRRGYFEEQLLSSALFRFYCAIGGECALTDDRRAASDYAVYLIMRAIQAFDAMTTPTRTIDGFVNELMHADTATQRWDVTAPWPEDVAPRVLHRVGGCVHKVMRWAFERQGLYATNVPTETVEGVGKPPPVDIFIADARPGEGGSAPPQDGGYWPAPLQWSTADEPWHASDAGITLRAGRLVVTVRNRGTLPANAVVVACWLWPIGSTPAPMPWAGTASPPQDVPPGSAVEFEFDPVVAVTGTDYFVFAAATCGTDRANIDPASGQPCATLGAPLVDLVANDNNLGLRVLTI